MRVSINPTVNASRNQTMSQAINQSINQPIDQSNNQPINQSTAQASTCVICRSKPAVPEASQREDEIERSRGTYYSLLGDRVVDTRLGRGEGEAITDHREREKGL